MTSPPEMSVVGTYPTEDEAERARAHLSDRGLAPVEIKQLDDNVWQVEAPTTRREEALDEIRTMEQHTVTDAW